MVKSRSGKKVKICKYSQGKIEKSNDSNHKDARISQCKQSTLSFMWNNFVEFSSQRSRTKSASKSNNMEVNIDEIKQRSCLENDKSWYDKIITKDRHFFNEQDDGKNVCKKK